VEGGPPNECLISSRPAEGTWQVKAPALSQRTSAPFPARSLRSSTESHPLSEVHEAIGYLEPGHARGKVVITV
jgi:hypothetical protein